MVFVGFMLCNVEHILLTDFVELKLNRGRDMVHLETGSDIYFTGLSQSRQYCTSITY